MNPGEMRQLPGFGLETSPLFGALAAADWSRAHRVPGELEIWTENGELNSSRSILVPLNESAPDYHFRLEQALEKTEALLPGRLARVMNAQNQASGAQVATIWRKQSSAPSGSIVWSEGRRLFDSTNRQLVAAARSAVGERRAVQGNRNQNLVNEFLERTLLAPSGVGSYVITALSPMDARLHVSASTASPQRGKSSPQLVSSLAVIKTLDAALSAASIAVKARTVKARNETFAEGVSHGVSVELLEALGDLVDSSEAEIVVPAGAWERGVENRSFSFSPVHAERFWRGARALKLRKDTEARISGYVTQIKRKPDSASGDVVVVDISSAVHRNVWVTLGLEEYEAAAKAHIDGEKIAFEGTLVKSARRWYLNNVYYFSVGDDEGVPGGVTDAESQLDLGV